MTKSNLKTHLKWLLDQGRSLNPILTPRAWESHVNPLDSHSNSVATLNLIENQTEELSIKDSQPILESTVNDFTGDVIDIDSDTDMARLMLSSPSSASKTRMLITREPPGSVRKTTESSSAKREMSQTPRGKPVNGTTAGPPKYWNALDCTDTRDYTEPSSTVSSFRDRKEQISTPVRPKQKLEIPSSLQDIDTIDLTDDFDCKALSSNIREEFDEPRRLWVEDAASRKESTDKRGKKRKSYEYVSDLLSPRKPSRKTRSTLVPSKTVQSDQYTSTLTPRLISKDEDTPSRDKKQRELSSKHAEIALSVADSDVETGGGLFDSVGTKQLSPQMTEKSLYPLLPCERNSSTTKQGFSPKRRELISPDLIGIPEITRKTIIRQSDTDPYSSRPSSDSEPRDQNVERFLQIPADSLKRFVTRLEDTVKKNSGIVYQGMLNGENTPELHAIVSENGTLTAQIRAVKALTAQRSAYLSREAQSKSLKDDIMHALNRGASNVLAKIEQQKEITSRMRDMEADMRRLLQDADLFSAIEKSSSEIRPSEPEQLHSLSTVPSNLGGLGSSNSRSSPVASNNAIKLAYDAKESRLGTSSYGTGSSAASFKSLKASFSNYHEPILSDDETTFTRTMGSPLPPVNDFDDFDMDVLDEDILEAANNYQDDQPFSMDRHEPCRRPVFAEASGNVCRLPSTQKLQTHGALWGQHPWTKDVKVALKERFHLRGFRPNQLEAIDSTLSGKDTFVLMPTGGGKSLCYQLPSVISSGSTRGVTLVISPLLSLMQDQVSHLRQNKIKAYLINGDTPSEERQWIISTLSSRNPETHIELLYITPEMISKSHALTDRIEALCSIQKLARVVIDEAHCVSQWGHDFRPDYKQIGAFRARIPGVPLMALTATATENVKVDVIHNLRMQGCEVFTQSFNRPNLTYEVRRKGKHTELLDNIADTIKSSYRNKCGIVYCLSRNACEKVAEALRKNYRIKAEHYHAGLDAETRARTQQRWQAGDVHVIVATIAFGMGIDKPDVRFVIHHSIPKSLEGYYQETGRAGRDGRRSGCYLYFSHRDVTTMQSMIEKNEDSSDVQKSRQTRMLNDVVKYCENANDCRRVQILAYFSESFSRQDCNASCDNCKSGDTFEVRDFSKHASAAVKIVRYFQERNERATLSYCVNIFRGTTKSFRSPEHREAPCFGDGSDIAVGDAERLFRKLHSERALTEENIVNKGNFPIQYVKLGPRASDFESGRRRLRLDVRVSLDGNGQPRGDVGRNYLPQSTNVSSPVELANPRRLERYRYADSAANESDTNLDSDGFEKVRIAGRRERKKKNLPGPPITQDDRFDQLDHLHRAVAEDFMVYAKNYCQEVVMDKGLRNQPFSDTILREMAMVLPRDADTGTDKREMLHIPNIDPDKVHRYGDKILKLIRDTQQRLSELKQEGDDVDGVVPDPNHHNVINVSDDEFSDADDVFMDQDNILQADDAVVTSQYFSRSQQPIEDDSGDEYPHSTKGSNSKSQKRKATSKRPPRRKSSGGKPRAKATRRPKTNGRSQGRSYQQKETKGRQKQPTSQIAMMPI
ncbi:hypothetical protein BDW66DRAFT_148541 [Aspergillus desertorum]